MSKSIFNLPGPQLAEIDNGPEPTLKEIVQLYYYNRGCFDDVELRDAYIKEWLKRNNVQ